MTSNSTIQEAKNDVTESALVSTTNSGKTGQHPLFTIERTVPKVEEFLNLRAAAGMSPRSSEGAAKGLGNELCCVILRSRQHHSIVGMGRVVGDGGTVFHICDMAVLPEYQRKGGGSLIMNELMRFIRKEAPTNSYVNLIADVDGFYEKYGFRQTAQNKSILVHDEYAYINTSRELFRQDYLQILNGSLV